MNQEIVMTAEHLISAHLWKAMAVFIIAFVIMGLIKHIASMIFEFILLKTDIFGRGSLLYYNGKKAQIKKIGLRRTKIHLLDTDEMIVIRTANWRKFELIDYTGSKKSKE